MSATGNHINQQDATTKSGPTYERPRLEQMRIPSGPRFPEFVYRFFNKLFRLDQAR